MPEMLHHPIRRSVGCGLRRRTCLGDVLTCGRRFLQNRNKPTLQRGGSVCVIMTRARGNEHDDFLHWVSDINLIERLAHSGEKAIRNPSSDADRPGATATFLHANVSIIKGTPLLPPSLSPNPSRDVFILNWPLLGRPNWTGRYGSVGLNSRSFER